MILLLGSAGRQGRRYRTILHKLGYGDKLVTADIEFEKTLDVRYIDCVIICTPTQTHYRYIKFFNEHNIDILCEKPLCTSSAEALQLQKDLQVDLRVVCNWSYVFNKRLEPEKNKIFYRNGTSGSDGLAWDCIQLIYLAQDFHCDLGVGVPWDIKINGKTVTPKMIEHSYIKMLADWLPRPELLWDISDAIHQICKVEAYLKLKAGDYR